MGVQEVSQDSWTVVKNKKKSKKESHFKKDAVFEATSKLNEKEVSLSCFGQVPQGTKMPLFQVPSSVVDGSRGNDSADLQIAESALSACFERGSPFCNTGQVFGASVAST